MTLKMQSDTRDRILYIGMETIALHGFHSAPMSMIAKNAKVAVGTIYRHFESKDTLVREINLRLEQRMMDSVMEHYPERRSVRERFEHVCRGLVNFYISHPVEFRFIEQFYNSPYGASRRRHERMNDNEAIMSVIYQEGQQQQAVKHLPLPILEALTFGPLLLISRNHILGYLELDDQAIAGTVEACWDAVRQPSVDSERQTLLGDGSSMLI